MRDYLTIGSSPWGEDCAQLGSDGYDAKSRKECQAYKNQLRREFGEEPAGARLAAKSFAHDFGSYREVVCHYDNTNAEAVEYAYKLESEGPELWDAEAKAELEGEPKLSFQEWMRKVNICVAQRIGLSAEDLPDQPYRDWYDSGMTPQDAAEDVLRNEAEFLFN